MRTYDREVNLKILSRSVSVIHPAPICAFVTQLHVIQLQTGWT